MTRVLTMKLFASLAACGFMVLLILNLASFGIEIKRIPLAGEAVITVAIVTILLLMCLPIISVVENARGTTDKHTWAMGRASKLVVVALFVYFFASAVSYVCVLRGGHTQQRDGKIFLRSFAGEEEEITQQAYDRIDSYGWRSASSAWMVCLFWATVQFHKRSKRNTEVTSWSP